MSGLAFCLIILAISLILSTNKLQSMTSRILVDSRAIETAHRLEKSILGERREDLLWRVTHDIVHFREQGKEFEESERIIREFPGNITSSEEQELFNDIKAKYVKYRQMVSPDSSTAIEEISTLTDSLLRAIEKFREQNRNQMTETLQESGKIDALVDRWSLIIIIVVSLIVLAGSLILINKLFKPMFELISTVDNFGHGNFTVRARIHQNDEIGMLCSTFNDMADNINNLMQERFNFIATVAHDLKNPLVMIGGAAHRVKKKAPVSENEMIWLDRIIENTESIENMINDLMDSVQIESGSLTLNKSNLELVSFVRDIQRDQGELITTHTIRFEGENECWISGDARRLRRAILNLISNAVKYSPADTTITIRVSSDESRAIITVEDRGVGIDQDEIPNLFLPYRRLPKTKDKTAGTGLGLFSVKKIIDHHGGSIHLTSSPGEGTTVEIVLPVSHELN